MRGLAYLALLALGVLVPADAAAYRTLADDPDLATSVPPTWAEPRVVFDVHSDSVVLGPSVLEEQALTAAASWRAPACTSFDVRSAGATASSAAPEDGRNTIEAVIGVWPFSGSHPDAAATTDVQLASMPGGEWRIVEADLYVDASGSAWADADLRRAVLHEWGHVLGFAHPCELDGAPVCSPEDRTSVMYPLLSGSGALSEDDAAGVCALYPACSAPCEVGQRCVGGACVDDDLHGGCDGGPCGTSCSLPEHCASGESCPIVGPRAGTCTPAGAVGVPCSSADECVTGLCLDGAASGAYCTRECAAASSCEPGQACRVVDGRNVCAPPAASGCAAGGGGQSTPSMVALGLALLLLARRRAQP